jgi:hypothetical protein
VQLKVPDPVLHPAGSELREVVEMLNALAGFPSLVTKVTVTGVVVSVLTLSEGGLAVPVTELSVVALYGMLTVPVLASPASLLYE